MKKRMATIYWDTDGYTAEECGLPKQVLLPDDVDEEDVEDYLSDKYGFCHNGYVIDEIEEAEL